MIYLGNMLSTLGSEFWGPQQQSGIGIIMRKPMKAISGANALLASAALAASMVMAQPAAALDAGWYGEALAGATVVNDAKLSTGNTLTFDLGYDIAGAIGYKTTMGWRGELEAAWRAANNDKLAGITAAGDVSSMSLMANVAYDINLGSALQPYIGAGIGFASLDSKLAGVKSDDTVFAYQGFLGVAYPFSKGIDLFGQYRYFATSDPNFNGVKSEVSTHNIEFGTRFHF
jgi:opacity protein-like surface antigen